MFLDYFALGLLFFVGIALFYGMIALHDIPYEIAKARNHPQQDAIHVAGWVSLFTLHAIWPFLWVWAMLYREDRGWGFQQGLRKAGDDLAGLREELHGLNRRIGLLEAGRPGSAGASLSSPRSSPKSPSTAPPASGPLAPSSSPSPPPSSSGPPSPSPSPSPAPSATNPFHDEHNP